MFTGLSMGNVWIKTAEHRFRILRQRSEYANREIGVPRSERWANCRGEEDREILLATAKTTVRHDSSQVD
jgi:hypothetical protein